MFSISTGAFIHVPSLATRLKKIKFALFVAVSKYITFIVMRQFVFYIFLNSGRAIFTIVLPSTTFEPYETF